MPGVSFPPAPPSPPPLLPPKPKQTNHPKKMCSLPSFCLGLSPISIDLLSIQSVALSEGGRDFRLQGRLKSSRGQCLEVHIKPNLYSCLLLVSSDQITMGQENTDYNQHRALKYTLTTYKLSPLTFYYSNRKKSQMSSNSVRHETLDRKVENLSLSSVS